MDREALNALALGQFALLIRRQLIAHGVPARRIDWKVRSKRRVTVHPGVYLTAPGRNDRPMRSMAAVLAAVDGAVLSKAPRASPWACARRPPP